MQTPLPILLLHSADISSKTPSTMRMQQSLIETAIAFPENILNGLWDYALLQKSSQLDCCTWRLIECTENRFSALFHIYPAVFNLGLKMEALPQTIEYIHLISWMWKFQARDVPRDLKYLFLQSKTIRSHAPSGGKQEATQVLNTADFPDKLEEAYLSFDNPVFRTVLMPFIPGKLRLLFISNGKCIARVILDNSGIPDTLIKCNVLTTSWSKKAVLIEFNGRSVDGRIRAINMSSARTHQISMDSFQFFNKWRNACIDSFKRV